MLINFRLYCITIATVLIVFAIELELFDSYKGGSVHCFCSDSSSVEVHPE